MKSILSSICILAGTYIAIDQYQLYMKRRTQRKAKEG